MRTARIIIREYGLTIDKAVEIVEHVGVSSLLADQIGGDDVIDKIGNCLVRLTTKNRKSIGIDVWRPERTEE